MKAVTDNPQDTTTIAPLEITSGNSVWIPYIISGIVLLTVFILLVAVYWRERICPCFPIRCSRCCSSRAYQKDSETANVPRKDFPKSNEPEESAQIIVHEPKSNSTDYSQKPEPRNLHEVDQTQRKLGMILANPGRRVNFIPAGSYQVARTAKIIGNILTTKGGH